jgi:outer membrane lipopolysaccharide assembly protein LptE/RlpB
MRGAIPCLALFGALLLGGCGFSQTSSAPVAQRVPVNTIAMMPGGGILADAVAVELSSRGFKIIDPAATSSLIVRLRLKEIEITQIAGLSRFKSQGIDAVLVVRAVGYDQQPQSASVRMTSTESGALIAGVTWQNGFGGEAGSVVDRVMRKGLSQAAAEIANQLAAQVAPSA